MHGVQVWCGSSGRRARAEHLYIEEVGRGQTVPSASGLGNGIFDVQLQGDIWVYAVGEVLSDIFGAVIGVLDLVRQVLDDLE
jgi:hypothetical protein